VAKNKSPSMSDGLMMKEMRFPIGSNHASQGGKSHYLIFGKYKC
jgi:hypothetical protein